MKVLNANWIITYWENTTFIWSFHWQCDFDLSTDNVILRNQCHQNLALWKWRSKITPSLNLFVRQKVMSLSAHHKHINNLPQTHCKAMKGIWCMILSRWQITCNNHTQFEVIGSELNEKIQFQFDLSSIVVALIQGPRHWTRTYRWSPMEVYSICRVLKDALAAAKKLWRNTDHYTYL